MRRNKNGGLRRIVSPALGLLLAACQAAASPVSESPLAPIPTRSAIPRPSSTTVVVLPPTSTQSAWPGRATEVRTNSVEASPSPTAPPATVPPTAVNTPVPSTLVPPQSSPGSTPVNTVVPVVNSFTISPPEIRPGEPVTLAWEAAAEKATIYQLDAQGRLSLPAYEVPLAGTLIVTTSDLLRNHVDFMLFATSGSASAQAGVSAKITCPDVWFFPNPPADCPGSAPHYTAMQAQHFERGLMLWTQWNDFIYILYADPRSPHWAITANAWFPGLPEDDPAVLPPEGLYQPMRGFGAAWRDENAPPGTRARDRLGWALDEEFSVSGAAYQCDSAPKYNRCYISGPPNAVYVLQPEMSGWEVWGGLP